MSLQLPTVNIFRYGLRLDANQPTNILRSYARNIHDSIKNNVNLLPFATLPINVSVLESRNTRYAEKQVKGIDENFYDYHNGIRLRHVNPHQQLPGRLTYLTEKSFSGDVSGDIGESVFAYFLIDFLNVNSLHIGHLRPDKKRRLLTPDFVIWEQNTILQTLFGIPYQTPLYAEVKSSTGVMGVSQIYNALIQLKTVMVRQPSNALLFLLYNRQNQGYEALLVGMFA